MAKARFDPRAEPASLPPADGAAAEQAEAPDVRVKAERARPVRADPRVDPTSVPPTDAADYSVERIVVSAVAASNARAAALAAQDASVAEPATSEEAAAPSRSITNVDPRFEHIEPLVTVNDWKGVAARLGAVSEAGKLQPNLGLIAAVAHNEIAEEGDQEARELAIRCTAGLLGIAPESEIVRILSRRLLRKNPVRFRERPAPPARLSLLIIAVTLALGAGAGWLFSSTAFARLFK